MKLRPTLDDVARRAEVSTATVSRCLSAPDKVRPELRQRVQAAIAALGYQPHGAARALASRRSNTIGAVIPTLDNAIFATVVQTLQDALALQGRTLLLASSDYRPERERSQIESLIVRGVDGLLLTGEERDPEVYELLARSGVRSVSTYVHHPDSPQSTIGFDNKGAMAKIVAYLHDLGHRRFAMIAGQGAENDRARERLQGVQDALRDRGLALPSERVLERPYSVDAGREALRVLISGSPRPSAIICGNDIQGLGALLEAQALGLAVPGDLSITGFDDLGLAKEIPPGLTTVHAPLAEMGRRAAAYLLAEEDSQRGPLHVALPTELVVRGSTGPAPRD